MTLDHRPLSDIQIRPDVNGSEGYSGPGSSAARRKAGVDPEADLVANQDFWKKLADSERMPFQMRVGQLAGNTVWMLAPSVQYTNLTYRDRNGIRAYLRRRRRAHVRVRLTGVIAAAVVSDVRFPPVRFSFASDCGPPPGGGGTAECDPERSFGESRQSLLCSRGSRFRPVIALVLTSGPGNLCSLGAVGSAIRPGDGGQPKICPQGNIHPPPTSMVQS
jgi:hypothetical protein